MGILNILTGGLMGGEMPKPIQVPQSVQPAAEEKTTSQVQAEEDAKKKAQLIAANASGGQTSTVGGGNADVTRKILLGL